MNKKHPFGLIIPIVSLIIITIQIIMTNKFNLSKWKGGGFGMYTEVHFNQYEVWISDVDFPLDSLIRTNKDVRLAINGLKLKPSDKNLYLTAQLLNKLTNHDSIIIQVWKPYIDINKSHYSREIANEIKYIN